MCPDSALSVPTPGADDRPSYIGLPFRHDIFVTYSHGDADGDGKSKLKQYSTGFVTELEEELKAIPGLGECIRVFRDEHHRPEQGMDPQCALGPELERHIKESALLLILMTPQYLKSIWCKDEREWFESVAEDHGLPAVDRLLLAKIWNADWQEYEEYWPKLLADDRGNFTVGRMFCDPGGGPHPFEWPLPEPTSKGQFRETLLKLVHDTVQKLQKTKLALQQRQRELESERRLAKAEGQIVYLHGRAPHQLDDWNACGRQLSDRGYVIQPGHPEPTGSNPSETYELRARRVERLAHCDALYLLGSADPNALNDDLIVVGRLDRHSAKDKSGRLLPCAVLDIKGLSKSNPVLRSNAESLGISWVDISSPTLPPEIAPWLDGASS